MTSVVLTVVVVGLWLTAKLTRTPTSRKDEQQTYQPTGNKLVDSFEVPMVPSKNERTLLIRDGASETHTTAYGTSNY